MDIFWMVYVDGKTGSTIPHSSMEGAMQEAERLVGQETNRGRKVYVLRTVGVCEAEPICVRWRGMHSF